MITSMTAVPEEPAIVETTATPPPPTHERLMALDAFRGLTVAGMLLVNNPGSWSAIYPPLEHASWNGWTPTDLVFPFFLFIVGITTHLSLGTRAAQGADTGTLVRRIVKRGLLIVLVGLLLNWFPFYWWGKIAGNASPTFLDRVIYRVQHLRYAGVLQRIGIAYMCAALLTLRTSRRAQVTIVLILLFGYWAVMTLIPVPGTGGILGGVLLDTPDKTLAAWSDRLILGVNHIWVGSKTYDPEGPLSTLPAIATAMLGVFAGRWIGDKRRPLIERIVGLYGVGCLGLVAGSVWDWFFPINKNIWTSSYVVFTAGFACVVLATCLWLIDVHQIKGWARPFVIYGVNPLVAFAGSGLMARIIDTFWKVNVNGKPTSVHQYTFDLFFAPYFPARFASLLWGLCFVTFWLGLLWLLHRRNIIVKL
jgi:predicted acyltransferase